MLRFGDIFFIIKACFFSSIVPAYANYNWELLVKQEAESNSL